MLERLFLNMFSFARYRKEVMHLQYAIGTEDKPLRVDMRHIYGQILKYLAEANQSSLVKFLEMYNTFKKRKVLFLALINQDIQRRHQQFTPAVRAQFQQQLRTTARAVLSVAGNII